MAQKRARRKKAKRSRRPRGWPRRPILRFSELEQSQLDAIGLGLVALGVFFSFVFYFGWDGGQVGGALVDGFEFLLGKVAYILPLAFLAAGAGLMLHQFLPSVAPIKAGGVLFLLSLTLGY